MTKSHFDASMFWFHNLNNTFHLSKCLHVLFHLFFQQLSEVLKAKYCYLRFKDEESKAQSAWWLQGLQFDSKKLTRGTEYRSKTWTNTYWKCYIAEVALQNSGASLDYLINGAETNDHLHGKNEIRSVLDTVYNNQFQMVERLKYKRWTSE